MLSPDGRWMVYQSDESGKNEVYVQAFPDKHGKRQISGGRGGYSHPISRAQLETPSPSISRLLTGQEQAGNRRKRECKMDLF